MNPQLKEILSEFNINKINYWIDSGTLLGIIREGDVLKNDKDIDISLHIDQIDKLNNILSNIRKLGYRIRYELYNGIPYKYKFYPKTNIGELRVDINIYNQKNESYLWCPVNYFFKPNNVLFKHFQKIIKFLWRKVFTKIEINKFPYNKSKKTYTWIIPYKYYNGITYSDRYSCKMFAEYKDYLKYRYGNWEIPSKEWNLFRDDGGIISKSPEILLKDNYKR